MKTRKSKFYVFEGIDGSGKTSVIKEIKNIDKNITTIQMFSKNNLLEKIIHRYPTSITLYCLILFKTFTKIITGKTLISDRYIQTIDTFSPDKDFIHNKIFRKIISSILPKPDLYIYMTANTETIKARLKKNDSEQYHQKLINEENTLKNRISDYEQNFEKYAGLKIKIDTTNASAKEIAEKIIKIINKKYVS